MSKVTKNQRINQIADQLARQQGVISKLSIMVKEQNEAILMLEKLTDEKLRDQPEPQLKQLDQSIFDGLDEKWKWAAVDEDGRAHKYEQRPDNSPHGEFLVDINEFSCDYELIGTGYDASNWQDSLIERDTAKELLEVDLSSELTGSDLARAMLARGDKFILCGVSDVDDSDAENHEDDDFLAEAVTDFDDKDGLFGTASMRWIYAVPINNQGEPLTASEVGL